MKHYIFLGVGLLWGLSACATTPVPTALVIPSATVTVSPTLFATRSPTQAPTTRPPTATSIPSPTRTEPPPPTLTPTRVTPHALALNPQNVQGLVQLQTFGRSEPRKVTWLANPQILAVASAAEISLLDPTSLEVMQTLNPQTAYPLIASGPQAERLFVAAKSVQVWDLKTGQQLTTLGHISGGIRKLALSANGQVLAIVGSAWPGGGDPDYTLQIIEVATGKTLYARQSYGILTSVAVSPDGRWVAVSGENGLEVFDGQTGALRQTIPGRFGYIALDANGLIVDGAQAVRLWEAQSGQLQRTLETASGSPTLSADGQWLALSTDAEIQIWSTTNYQLVQTLTSPDRIRADIIFGPYGNVAFSPDNSTLVAVTEAGLVWWDIANGQITHALTGFTPPIDSVAFSVDSLRLLGEIAPGTAQAWDIASGAPLSNSVAYAHAPSINVTSPNGQVRAEAWLEDDALSLGGIRLINTKDETVLHELVAHTPVSGEGFAGVVQSLVFNWDGSLLASAGYDQRVQLWEVGTGHLLLTLPPQTLLSDVNFSLDGRYLATSSSDGTLHLWGLPDP